MAQKQLIAGLILVTAGSPIFATSPEPNIMRAPAGTPETKYCMRIEASTGTIIERVRCWTREEWAANDVNVDEDWAREGVAIIDESGRRHVKS